MQTLNRLAQAIKAELIGDPQAVVSRACPFDAAGEGDVTLALGAAYRLRIKESPATAIIVAPPAEEWFRSVLVAENPRLAFARAIHALHGRQYESRGVSPDLIAGERTALGSDLSILPRVTIGRDSIIGDRVTLHPGVVIGDRCRIGDDTTIFSNVSIYDDCEIGSRVIVHSGSVIGSDGFGFVADEMGHQVKMLQPGRVRIEDDCEIGANCTIDRGLGDTVLRRGVKLDNLIQVGHNTEIGEDTVVAALTGFSGGTRVGRRCVIAAQVGTKEHITIGDGATVTAKTAVIKSVRAGAVVGGMMPAQDLSAWRKSQVYYFKLPELAARLRRLERIAKNSARGADNAG
ncbi:MAG TPA: UDP-3-O-(3-hydroxymyristoyl)glucosamine N-acyltransferase [Blastocatellia bacterium]|nr:UDP-3-O-(3-hydroxymyristoyl)glucosamine N-acyltransferase [Blastocatellia bacterium]